MKFNTDLKEFLIQGGWWSGDGVFNSRLVWSLIIYLATELGERALTVVNNDVRWLDNCQQALKEQNAESDKCWIPYKTKCCSQL